MKTLIVIMLLGPLFGVPYNLIVDHGIDPPGETIGIGSDSDSRPEEALREYIRAAKLCDGAATKALTAPVPDDSMVKLNNGDRSVLRKDIRTPKGLVSDADAMRGVYQQWVGTEFPDFVCKNKLEFGNILAQDASVGRAEISINFLTTFGEFRHNWIFRLAKVDGEWKIYDIVPPVGAPQAWRETAGAT